MSDVDALRRVVAAEAAAGIVRAFVRDDFHHFTVTLMHEGGIVTDVAAEAVRVPWTTCPGAIAPLLAFRGQALASGTTRLGSGVDATQHCTHLLDLARFAAAQAVRGGSRHYAMTIARELPDGLVRARLERDGRPCLDWRIDGVRIVSPAAFAGHVVKGRAVWPEGAIADSDMLEAAMILRRGLLVQRGAPNLRGRDPDRATAFPGMMGTCFTFQPGRIEGADRAVASFRTGP